MEVVIKELSMLKMEVYIMSDYLKHYGILGMKWGVRRFQNKDGSLTPEGKRRYRRATSSDSATKKVKKRSGSKMRKFLEKQAQNNINRYMKKEDIRNQRLQKRAAELVSKYGDKYKVMVKGNKIVLSDGVNEWTIH